MKRLVTSWSIFVCLIVAMNAQALETDKQQPITIEADRVDVDDAKGLSTYRGNVVLQQGSMELRADELIISATQKRELESVKAIGKPAHFKQQATPESGEMKGRALEITYKVDTEYMLFVGEAYFWQCGDEVFGNQVEYWGKEGLVKARKAESGKDRVTVTLQPREEGKSTKICGKKAQP